MNRILVFLAALLSILNSSEPSQIAAASSPRFSVENWTQKYLRQRSSHGGHSVSISYLVEEQGSLTFRLHRTPTGYNEEIYDPNSRLLETINSSRQRVIAADAHGSKGQLTDAQQSEFISESALETANFAPGSLSDHGTVRGLSNVQRLRYEPSYGARIDIWVDSSSNRIVMAFILVDNKVVHFRPLSYAQTRDGLSYVASWQRDNELPINVNSVRF